MQVGGCRLKEAIGFEWVRMAEWVPDFGSGTKERFPLTRQHLHAPIQKQQPHTHTHVPCCKCRTAGRDLQGSENIMGI